MFLTNFKDEMIRTFKFTNTSQNKIALKIGRDKKGY